MIGDPINAATNNKYIEEADYTDGDWLGYRRFYNGLVGVATTTVLGEHWRHSFSRQLIVSVPTGNTVVMVRPDGSLFTFMQDDHGIWQSRPLRPTPFVRSQTLMAR